MIAFVAVVLVLFILLVIVLLGDRCYFLAPIEFGEIIQFDLEI
ncbi:hypothetical protein [Chengkuizengella sediminis]|nr:hypothetical protein [Chengkuizengella sediminis]